MNNITFTGTKFNFVDFKTFEKTAKGDFVDFWMDSKLHSMNSAVTERPDIKKVLDFFTYCIRSCTAGFVKNSETGEIAAFHILDCPYNLKFINDILKNIFTKVKNPDSAFLLGGKDEKFAKDSMPIFNTMYDEFTKRIENVTAFKQHVFPYSESNIHYSPSDDTCTIHSMYRPIFDKKTKYATSEKNIKECFKEVILANGDSLYIKDKKIEL